MVFWVAVQVKVVSTSFLRVTLEEVRVQASQAAILIDRFE